MKKPTLLYIPLVLLFALALSVLAVHYWHLMRNFNRASSQVELPYTLEGVIRAVSPEGDAAGFRVGDRITAINGRAMDSNDAYYEEIAKLRPEQSASFTVARKTAEGETQDYQVTFTPKKRETDFSYYSRLVIGFTFVYFLPTFCIFLGFWVVFVRPRDPLAWLLLFMLLGFSAAALEGSPNNTLIGFYAITFFSTWALAMLLFGIYFPERWSVDQKYPWIKWILIVPLCLQVLFVIFEHFETFFGINILRHLTFITAPYGKIAMPLNLVSIGMFFAALGHKSGTLKNADARRRLRLMLFGTALAMTPSFAIILYRLVSGAKGSFFELVPFWFALFALFSMLLFPLTMAYVIVVQRAMDVSVVVRQGLQYGLAKNGVLVLQILLSIGVALVAFSFVSDVQTNRPQKLMFIALGVTGVFLIRLLAEKIRAWTDRKFFREAYNAEQILSDLSEEVRTMVETKPLLETVSGQISRSLHVPQVALLLKNGDAFEPAYALGYDSGAPDVSLTDTDKTIEKLKTNEPLLVYQDDEDSWVNEEARGGERDNLRRLNSQLLLPVGAKNQLSGVISLSPKLSDSPYTPTDLRLLKSVAAQTGLALENSRLTEAIVSEAAQRERMNREVEIAREVQERLFPQELPPVQGLDYFGACRPALGVGGDYYDFLELPEGKFGIAVGDVSGKGIGAALLMASLQASLRGQVIHFQNDLAELMNHVNKLVYEASTANRYATFFYAQFDPGTRRLAYVNAGHNPPFVVRRRRESDDFEVLRLEEGGAVVGMLPPLLVSYKQGEIQLQKGDLLVGFTDGISEAMNLRDEEWGEEQLLEAIKERFRLPALEMLEYLVECADKFAAGAKQHDDMTLIIVRVI